MSLDLAEVFTESSRRVLPIARAKGLTAYFDYRGPQVELAVDELRMQSAMHRLLIAMIELIDQGFVMFTAELAVTKGKCELVVNAAGTGGFASEAEVGAVLQRLGLHYADAEARDAAERHAYGPCPVLGADVSFVSVKGESMVFTWRLSAPAHLLVDEDSQPDASGAEAWLVSAKDGGLDSVELRLRRLGWRVTNFFDVEYIVSRLASLAPGRKAPALLLVAESSPADLALLERLATKAHSTWIVLGVESGSPALAVRDSSPVDIRVLPLSPADLLTFTRHVDFRTSTAESRLTAPAPLYVNSRRTILVVDDNVVNQMVATGLLDALGYEVEAASNGEEALARCCIRPPAMVLMDVNMPVMDGLEATRQLRLLQSVGDVPPFPVIAATANEGEQARQDCLAAGMDGFLQKPLDIHSLKSAVLRALPARPAHDSYS